jgi:hypothetical protein
MTKHHPAVQFLDLTAIDARLKGFSGCVAVDGDIIFAPLMNGAGVSHGLVVRLSVGEQNQVNFCDVSQWFEGAAGFVGLIGDGRYVYFIPYFNQKHHGNLVRYDTMGDFMDRASWDCIDLQTLVHPAAKGFVSGSFDGKYLYIAPYQSDWTHHHGTILRYDTTCLFHDAASWSHFDAASVHPDARGYHSSISTPDQTWFVPYVLENRGYHGHLVHLDSTNTAGFTSIESWKHLDLTTIHPQAKGYVGGCHDGRYVYLAPYYNGSERHGLVLQYDTEGDLIDPAMWNTFDLTTIHKDLRGFFGAVHHKDYIYILPHCKEEGIYHGTLVRYDRRLPFGDRMAWSYLDTTEYHPSSKGYMGCCLSGNVMILSPYETTAYGHSGIVCSIDLEHAPFNQHLTTEEAAK